MGGEWFDPERHKAFMREAARYGLEIHNESGANVVDSELAESNGPVDTSNFLSSSSLSTSSLSLEKDTVRPSTSPAVSKLPSLTPAFLHQRPSTSAGYISQSSFRDTLAAAKPLSPQPCFENRRYLYCEDKRRADNNRIALDTIPVPHAETEEFKRVMAQLNNDAQVLNTEYAFDLFEPFNLQLDTNYYDYLSNILKCSGSVREFFLAQGWSLVGGSTHSNDISRSIYALI